MTVLEELWYGNLEPSEFDSSSSKEIQGAATSSLPQRRETSGKHDRRAEGIVLQVFGLCPGISRSGGMPAVSE